MACRTRAALLSSASGADAGDAKPGDDDAATAPATGEPTPVAGLSYPASLPARQGDPGHRRGRRSRGADADARGPCRGQGAEPAAPAPKEAAKATAKESPAEAPKESPKAAAPAAVPPPPSTAPAPAEDGGFTVQVTALKNRPEADAIAQRLQGRGYKAYVVAPSAGGQVIYKVRVGVNMQRQEADKVMRRLQNEEKFKPWITR